MGRSSCTESGGPPCVNGWFPAPHRGATGSRHVAREMRCQRAKWTLRAIDHEVPILHRGCVPRRRNLLPVIVAVGLLVSLFATHQPAATAATVAAPTGTAPA